MAMHCAACANCTRIGELQYNEVMMQAVDPSDPWSPTPPTVRLYWQDDHCFETTAMIVGLSAQAVALDQSCFYPGGGGQPADEGWLWLPQGEKLAVPTATVDAGGVIWHSLATPLPADCLGQRVTLRLDETRRLALMRHHTVLHVLNTIVWRDYAGWITGVQIGTEYARIDFTLTGFSPTLCDELTGKVNVVLAANHTVKAYWLTEAEAQQRADLRRTLDAQPPLIDGRLRVVEISGFDVQACGGTHVHTTGEVGTFSIFRTENKGKQNKRLYVRLTLSMPQPSPSV